MKKKMKKKKIINKNTKIKKKSIKLLKISTIS